jgi:hypothetical protein
MLQIFGCSTIEAAQPFFQAAVIAESVQRTLESDKCPPITSSNFVVLIRQEKNHSAE